jgi:hypothetical protein
MARSRRDSRCSFCGKDQDQVGRLIAGPEVFICDECVRLCNEIIADPPSGPVATGTRGPKRSSWRDRLRWPLLAGGLR